jgi:hypothetical protein
MKERQKKKQQRKTGRSCCRELDVPWDDLDRSDIGAEFKVVECSKCQGRGLLPSRSGLELLRFFKVYERYDIDEHPLGAQWLKEDEDNRLRDDDEDD